MTAVAEGAIFAHRRRVRTGVISFPYNPHSFAVGYQGVTARQVA